MNSKDKAARAAAEKAEKVARLALLRGGARVKRFTVVDAAAYRDVVLCYPFGGSSDEQVWVAKPYLLRALASHAGVSYTYPLSYVQRTANKPGQDPEQHFVTEEYASGDSLLAVASAQQFSAPDFAEPTTVRWMDLNVDARAWAHDPEA